MSDLFTVLETVLLDGESLAFHLTRKGTMLVGMIIPQLSASKITQHQSNPNVERARESLALPLRLEMSAEQMDAEFGERARGYSAQRVELQNGSNALIEAINETVRATRDAAAAEKKKRAQAKTPAKPAELPPPTDPSATPQPDSSTSPETQGNETQGALF